MLDKVWEWQGLCLEGSGSGRKREVESETGDSSYKASQGVLGLLSSVKESLHRVLSQRVGFLNSHSIVRNSGPDMEKKLEVGEGEWQIVTASNG